MTFKNIEDHINEIYSLKHIIRYNNIPKITQESVAEHSFFVAAIVLFLYQHYSFDLAKALTMAITHDYIETYISDIPRNVKNKYPLLNDALKLVEENAWKDVYPEYSDLNKEFENKLSIEAKVVQLADSLSIIQYTKVECNLGNEGYMKSVYEFTLQKVKEMFEELEGVKR